MSVAEAVAPPAVNDGIPEALRPKYAPAPTVAKPFVPVDVGDTVLWYAPGSSQAAVAIVSSINGDGSIWPHVLPSPSGYRDVLIQDKQRVLHRNEPRDAQDKITATRMYGTWDLTEGEKKRRADMASLLEMFDDLQKQMKGLRSVTHQQARKTFPNKKGKKATERVTIGSSSRTGKTVGLTDELMYGETELQMKASEAPIAE